MIQFKLTDKVMEFFGFEPAHLSAPTQSGAVLGNWGVDSIALGGLDSLLFVSEKTLFSFVLLDVPADHSDSMPQAFVNALNQLLLEEKFAKRSRTVLFRGINTMEITAIADDPLLGLTHEVGQSYLQMAGESNDFDPSQMLSIIKKMNRKAQSFLGGQSPLAATKDILRQSN